MKRARADARGAGCLFLFCLPFAAVGVLTAGLALRHLAMVHRMQAWYVTEARVEAVRAHKVTSGDSSKWRIEGQYRYLHDGAWRAGSRIGVVDEAPFGGSLRARESELLEAMRSGATVPCYVNPALPDDAVLYRSVAWNQVYFFLVFAVVFGGVGVGGIAFALHTARASRKARSTNVEHPEEPWMRREDWARGVIRSSSGKTMVGLWFFAILWNAVSSPVLFAIPEELREGNRAILVALLFPLVGLGLLTAAIHATLRWRKYGAVELVLGATPVPLGGRLVAAVRVPFALDAEGPVELELHCGRAVTTGSGKNRRTTIHTLWSRAETVPPARLQRGRQTLVPVDFPVPYDTASSGEPDITWTLRVRCKTPGIDLASDFELPVFATAASDPSVTREARAVAAMPPEAMEKAARTSKIDVRALGGGALQIDVPPAARRAPGMLAFMVIFTALWCGVVYALLRLGAPVVFPIVFGFVAALLLVGLGSMLGHRVTARIDAVALTVEHAAFGVRWQKVVPVRDIVGVAPHATGEMQAGNRSQTHFSVRVRYRDPAGSEKHLSLADSIAGEPEARWLAAQVIAALPLARANPTAAWPSGEA